MATRKKSHARRAGLLIDAARVISVGRDRSTGQAVLRFCDERGRIVALRLRPQQFRTLAHGVLGLAGSPAVTLTPGGISFTLSRD